MRERKGEKKLCIMQGTRVPKLNVFHVRNTVVLLQSVLYIVTDSPS